MKRNYMTGRKTRISGYSGNLINGKEEKPCLEDLLKPLEYILKHVGGENQVLQST